MDPTLYRACVREFDPYEWEPSARDIARRFGLEVDSVVRFDLNTSPFLPDNYTETLTILSQRPAASGPPINEYPDAAYDDLTAALSAYTGVQKDSIVIGAGADEVLDVIAKLFLDNGDSAILCSPSYVMYGVVTAVAGAKAIDVGRRDDFGIDIDAIVAASAAHRAKVVWLCNPNNPTGNLLQLSEIRTLLERLERKSVLVVDEAYFEMCGESAASLIPAHPNLIVVRTLSKLFSLAGARVGYCLSTADVAAMLNRVRPPNSLSSTSLALAVAALRDPSAALRTRVEALRRSRDEIAEAVASLPCRPHVFPSVTNFVLARFAPGERDRLNDALLARGLVVRCPGHSSVRDCLRFTARDPGENSRLVGALRELCPARSVS